MSDEGADWQEFTDDELDRLLTASARLLGDEEEPEAWPSLVSALSTLRLSRSLDSMTNALRDLKAVIPTTETVFDVVGRQQTIGDLLILLQQDAAYRVQREYERRHR